jgi:hypothetical protein
VEPKETQVKKRDEKALDKREHAIERAKKATVEKYKDEMKVSRV